MWYRHLLNLLHTALTLSVGYMGTTIFALSVGLVFFLLRETYTWRNEGKEAMKKAWKGTAGFGLLLAAGLWSCLFLFCVTKAVYDEHQSLVSANATLRSETATLASLQADLDNSAAKIKELEAELEKRTRGSSATRNFSLLDEIGRLSDEGAAIQARFIDTNDTAALKNEYGIWTETVMRLLTSRLNSSFAVQFKNANGNAMMGCPNGRSVEGCGYWQAIEGRKEALMAMVLELRQRR